MLKKNKQRNFSAVSICPFQWAAVNYDILWQMIIF